MKKLITVFLAILLLFGCAEKTAEQHGKGISVEIGNIDEQEIRYVGITIYLNELLFVDGFVYKEDYGLFQTGDVVWFETPIINNKRQEIEVHYSRNADGSYPKTTNKIDITEAKEWVNAKLNDELQLELSEFR